MAGNMMKPAEGPHSLEAGITLALETAPRPSIPADFAARVAAQVSALPTAATKPGRYGRTAALGCAVILLPLILLFAHPAVTSPVSVAVECIFCIQLALIAVWLAAGQVGFLLPRRP